MDVDGTKKVSDLIIGLFEEAMLATRYSIIAKNRTETSCMCTAVRAGDV